MNGHMWPLLAVAAVWAVAFAFATGALTWHDSTDPVWQYGGGMWTTFEVER